MEFDFSVPKWSKIMLNAPSFKVLKLVKKPLYNTDEFFIPKYVYEHLIAPLSMPKVLKI